jgi:cytochrome c oxidase assembly protein subunit 15
VRGTVFVSLLLVMLLVSLSAYLRLAHSGIGCADWPDCYARIGDVPVESQRISSENAYQRIVAEASQPLAWATPLHRLVASVLGLLMVWLMFLSLKFKKDRLISLALLATTVFLALLGVISGGPHSPAVVMGNLGGGFLMLGLLGWMFFNEAPVKQHAKQVRVLPAGLLVVTGLMLVLQIFLGGLTSANFAATACQSLPDCHGVWLPGSELWTAVDLTRQHEVTSMGQAIGGQERIDIHIAHRLGAVLTASLLLVVGIMAWRAGGRLRVTGVFVLALLLAEFSVGVASVATGLPIVLAVAHNWLAGLLLLFLLKISALGFRNNNHHYDKSG